MCLGNILKYFTVDNMNKTVLYGYVYDFSVDYDSIDADDILDIHKYFIKSMMYSKVMSIKGNVYWIIRFCFDNYLV